jgi:hypothetical protein
MQKLTIVLLFALLALATATPMKFKKLTPINPEPHCSILEVAACAGEIGGISLCTVHYGLNITEKIKKDKNTLHS